MAFAIRDEEPMEAGKVEAMRVLLRRAKTAHFTGPVRCCREIRWCSRPDGIIPRMHALNQSAKLRRRLSPRHAPSEPAR